MTFWTFEFPIRRASSGPNAHDQFPRYPILPNSGVHLTAVAITQGPCPEHVNWILNVPPGYGFLGHPVASPRDLTSNHDYLPFSCIRHLDPRRVPLHLPIRRRGRSRDPEHDTRVHRRSNRTHCNTWRVQDRLSLPRMGPQECVCERVGRSRDRQRGYGDDIQPEQFRVADRPVRVYCCWTQDDIGKYELYPCGTLLPMEG